MANEPGMYRSEEERIAAEAFNKANLSVTSAAPKLQRNPEVARHTAITSAPAEPMSEHDQAVQATIRTETSPITEQAECVDKTREVIEAFNSDKLLARAMTPILLSRNPDGSLCHDFNVWDTEFDDMQDGGMDDVSCTLLIPGEEVRVYKPYGFLMNGDKSHVRHLSETDSGSRGTGEEFRANPSEIKNLPELAAAVRKFPGPRMNEVNAQFTEQSISGLFVSKAPNPRLKLDIILVQQHLKERGLDLPLFVYDLDNGQIEPSQTDRDEIQALIDKENNSLIKNLYASEFSLATPEG